MQQILLATDFSSRSASALRRAGMLAKESGASLALTHVVDDDQPQEIIDAETRAATSLLERDLSNVTELFGVRCGLRIDFGEPFVGIVAAAEAIGAELIVMGAHRRQLLRDIFVGTTLERVIRTGTVPVLMVNADARGPYRRGLAAVDLSQCSAYALRAARKLGLLDGMSLTILHVHDAMAKGLLITASVPEPQLKKYLADASAAASRELRGFLAKLDLKGVRYVTRVEEGSPVERISSIASELDADLLVIGTHGRTGAAKLILGSVAEGILRSLERDILAVPPAASLPSTA